MTYLQDVESAYQEWVKERRAEGKLEGMREGKLQIANKMVRAKFGDAAIDPPINAQLATLTETQFDELTTKIFEWQQIDRLVDWLNSLPT